MVRARERSRRSAWLSKPVPLSVQAARVWMFCASSEIERGKSVGLLLVRAPRVCGRLMPDMATRTRSPHCANWPSFLALAADGILVWVGGESPDHHNFSHETLGRATERPLLVAGDPEAGRQARHRGSGAEVRWSIRMAGCAAMSAVSSVTTGRSASPPPRGEEWSDK